MRIPAVALALAMAGPASAVSIAPSEQGWMDFQGAHVGGSINTFTGRTGIFASCDPARPPVNCVESARSFYVFPLAAGVT